MNLPALRGAHRITSLALVAVLFTSVAPASAFAVREKPLDRKKAISRAKKWAGKRIKYSQRRHAGGYRRDCSGLVSYAWDLPENLTTWRMPLVAKRISKRNLQPGDVLLDFKSGGGGRHVVIFEKWANKKKTRYWAIEQTGQRGVRRAVRRVVPYPYRVNKRNYKPYRYVGMSKYYRVMKRRDLQPVSGYNGRVETPSEVRVREAKAAKSRSREKARKLADAQARAKARTWARQQVAKARAAADRKAKGPVELVASRLAERHQRNAAILEFVIGKAVIRPVRAVIVPDVPIFPKGKVRPAEARTDDMDSASSGDVAKTN